ncbi:MAG: A24 family peptidase [Anaerolineae bacterium]|nr:A24 family peptidase [Anaerolineae bacterium]
MAVLFAFLGLVAGGIVNQLGSDLPARRAVSRPHCRYCGKQRPWWQWISLPAVIAGHLKCTDCGKPIGLRHPLTELGLAAAYALLWVNYGPSIQFVLYLVYSAIFAVILITDLERLLILNVIIYPAIILAIIASSFTPQLTLRHGLLGGAIAFGFFFVAALVGNAIFGSGALGAGDVKLAAFVGLLTGFPLVIEALILTILVGAVVSLLLLLTRVRRLQDPVPYGPFLVIGAVITLLWGYEIAVWFLF